MKSTSGAAERVTIIDEGPAPLDVRRTALAGLTTTPKTLPASLLYDKRGSELFERITKLPEYYPTRTEISILRSNYGSIQRALEDHARIVEFGTGSGLKTRLLLDGLDASEYVALDISRSQLVAAAGALARRFPQLEVRALCVDYVEDFVLPPPVNAAARTVFFFPGSTIGNFEPAEAEIFLRRVRRLAGADGGLLIGVDLHKDEDVLHAAYNDAAGVTAEFNLNVLTRLNREAGANFDVGAFRHAAIYETERQRIEMRLISDRAQEVTFAATDRHAPVHISFAAQEAIVTEHSYKYSVEGFSELARRAGWSVRRRWLDRRSWFAVFMLA